MTVGVIETQMPQNQRRKEYDCDLVYGTAKEFGFDFLRDRLLLRRIREGQNDLIGAMMAQGTQGGNENPVQKEAHFGLGRRGRQYPDRRGADPAHHQRVAQRRGKAGRRVLRLVVRGGRPVRRGHRLRIRPRQAAVPN